MAACEINTVIIEIRPWIIIRDAPVPEPKKTEPAQSPVRTAYTVAEFASTLADPKSGPAGGSIQISADREAAKQDQLDKLKGL